MDTLKLTELLADRLGIEIPPVGMAFVKERPADVPPLYRDPPSFCSLWRMAELRVLYASAEQHNGCGIGGGRVRFHVRRGTGGGVGGVPH